jgi:multimeric flavodoxin WrbA
LDLADIGALDVQRNAFLDADEVLIAFPLYTDSMPGIVKNFFDSLASADIRRLAGKRLAFVIQSGFPESMQSESAAEYCSRLCGRLGCTHAGTIVKAGLEGIRLMPEQATRRLRESFMEAGRELAIDGRFSETLISAMARPRRLSLAGRIIYRLLALTGLSNFYWDMMLRKYHAYARRFDAPYGEASSGRH